MQQNSGGPLIGYRGVESESTGLSGVAMQLLRESKPWVRFLALMTFIAAAIMALGGMGMLFIRVIIGDAENEGVSGWKGAAWLTMAAIAVVPAVLLNLYANAIAGLMRTQQMSDVERVVAAQRSFWKFSGMMLIILMGICAVVTLRTVVLKGRL